MTDVYRISRTAAYSFFFLLRLFDFWETNFQPFGRQIWAPQAPYMGAPQARKETDFGAPQAPHRPKETDFEAPQALTPKETSLKGIYVLRDTLKVRILP